MELSRREFAKMIAAATVVPPTVVPRFPQSQEQHTIGIQVGAVSFVDENVEPVLERFQSARINALFIAAFSYGRGIAGRQVPGQPLPDHGKQEYDSGSFHGGSYAAIHSQYYANTPLKNLRAPDLGSFDVFERSEERRVGKECRSRV